jgi:hypothetical protein
VSIAKDRAMLLVTMTKDVDSKQRKTLRKQFNFVVPLTNLATARTRFVGSNSLLTHRCSMAGVARFTVNGAVEVRASLVRMGVGTHPLQLNARTCGERDIKPGDRKRVALEKPPRLPMLSTEEKFSTVAIPRSIESTPTRSRRLNDLAKDFLERQAKAPFGMTDR